MENGYWKSVIFEQYGVKTKHQVRLWRGHPARQLILNARPLQYVYDALSFALPLGQADGKLPADQQRGYRGVFHALYRIARDEGVLAYWRGGGTTGEPTTRVVVVIVVVWSSHNIIITSWFVIRMNSQRSIQGLHYIQRRVQKTNQRNKQRFSTRSLYRSHRVLRPGSCVTYLSGHACPPLPVLRAMVVSVTQIATYDQAKESLAPYVQGFRQHLVAGMVSALTFTTVSMPFDTVKTRVQQVWLDVNCH